MKLKHIQTGEVKEGTFDELQGLDNRLWRLMIEPFDEKKYTAVEGSWGKYFVRTMKSAM